MNRPYICFIAIHQETGKTASRTLWNNVQFASNSLPSWERRFKAFFDVFRGNKKIGIDQLLAWMRKHGFKPVDAKDNLFSKDYAITMLITADEFLEFTYERSLKIPRVRSLREISYVQ